MDKRKAAEKVVYLLRLAQNNPNNNEAEAAGKAASRLVEKYGLTDADIKPLIDEQRRAAGPSQRNMQRPRVVVRVVFRPTIFGGDSYTVVGSPYYWGGTSASTSTSTTSSGW